MRNLRYAAPAALLIAAVLMPSSANARPCVNGVCVPPPNPLSGFLDHFCAIADGPLVEIICSLG